MNYYIPNFERYTLSEAGVIIDTQTGDELTPKDSKIQLYRLYNNVGKVEYKRLKRLYKEVFNQDFAIDKIPDLPGERWKLIPGYNGRYKASSKGRIKSLCGVYTRILKPCDNGHGYFYVELSGKKRYIHRLVCLAFLGEPEEGKNTVHHKSEIKCQNNIENLCWLSLTDNIREYHAKRAEEKKNNEKLLCAI